jgi:integrase
VENKFAIGLVRDLPDKDRLVEDDPRRFGFHNLRHSLASFLVRMRTDPKTVQTLLRHSDVKLTLQFYSHAVSQDRMAAAGQMLTAILSHESGLAPSIEVWASPLE